MWSQYRDDMPNSDGLQLLKGFGTTLCIREIGSR